jgi:hypothetical protein
MIVLVVLMAGCGPDRPPMVTVRGKVTFDGAPPPAIGMVFFAPIEAAEGLPRRPGRAIYEADGSFRIGSFDRGDGLVPGLYRVRVECWKSVPSMESPGESYVADDYAPQDVNVPADEGTIDVTIDVPAAG